MEKLVQDPFLKKSNLSISQDQQSEVSYSLFFFVCPSGGLPKQTEIKLQTTCLYFIQSFFKRQKEACN